MDDISTVTQVVLHERQSRDRSWWKEMEACYWPDSRVSLSWLDGSGHEFVEGSKKLSQGGDVTRHRNSPPAVHIRGDRALVELPTGVEFRIDWDGIPADLVTYSRLNYRLEKRDGVWKIVALNAIYERDTLTPVRADQPLKVGDLSAWRASYPLLSLFRSKRGLPVNNDLLGDDQPERVAAFYSDAFDWLNGVQQ